MNIFNKVPGLVQQTRYVQIRVPLQGWAKVKPASELAWSLDTPLKRRWMRRSLQSKLGSVLQRAFYGSSGRVTLFEQRNFAGRRLDLSSDCSRISDRSFPERCNSVQVESGAWVGYEHENFRGRQYLWDMTERGEYNCYDKWCAQADHVSSVRSVKQDTNPARAQLFERAGYSGKKMEIQDDIPNLMSRYSLNRIASIRVLGGAWVVYQEPNYRGPHYVLEKRDFNNFTDWGSQNSTVGSMRRVRFN